MKRKIVKMNILTLILSSKYFFQIRGSQTFPCQGPPKLHVFGRRPTSRKKGSRDPQKQRFELMFTIFFKK